MQFLILLTLSLTFLQASSRAYTDIPISSLTASDGITIDSLTSTDDLGFSVKNAGDFNHDGFQDFIIGSRGASSNFGAVYVVFGSSTGLVDLTVDSGATAPKSMKIIGSSAEKLGYSVSYAGDVNKDGIDDIIIAGSEYSTSTGIAYVIYGSGTLPSTLSLTSALASSQGFRIIGGSTYNFLGSSVSYAGDVNHDGIDDIIIGANGASGFRGAAYVIFGKAGFTRGDINIALGLSSADGFAIIGPSGTGFFGGSVSNVGDIDGDHIDDVVIGAYGVDKAYVIYGKDTSVSGAFSTIDLSSALSSSQGFTMNGAAGSKLGNSVSFAGDFNQDGWTDVIIGASGENAAYVIYGNARTSLVDMSLSGTVSFARGLRIKAAVASSAFGGSVSGVGDINSDGFDDVLIGASSAEKAYVVFGSNGFVSTFDLSGGFDGFQGFTIIGETAGDYFGAAVSYAGDVNKDGLGDFIVGAFGGNSASLLFAPPLCPANCLTCDSLTVCWTCKPGFTLVNSLCITCPVNTELVNGVCVPKETSLGTAAGVASGVFNSGSAASRIFTMGRSLSVGLGLMAKIIQNVRFLDIDYPAEALNAFKTYGTDLFEVPIPGAFYESPETKDLPSQYARYDMEPSFLENYWDTIMTMLICLAALLVIKFTQFLTKSQRKDHIVQVALKNIGQTFANFFIIQIYSNLDDVVFYLFLDIKSTELSSPSAGTSLGAGILFLLLGLSLVFFHCWMLGKYQQAKSQGNLERFEAKYRILGTLYEDFKDDSIAKQSFFGILILRCVILVLVIVLLQPQWMQATLLMLTNLAFLGYLIYQRPFKSLFDEVVQYFCELSIFAAYLPVLILSILDAETVQESGFRNGLGKSIVIAGIVLALGGFIVQVIQIFGAIIGICKFVKSYNKKKSPVKISPSSTILIDHSQNQQSSGTRPSESSMILRPSNLDHLELISTSQRRNQRPLEREPFYNQNQRVPVRNHDDNRRIGPVNMSPNRQFSERAGEGQRNQPNFSPGKMRPDREYSERTGQIQRNQAFPGPQGSQIPYTESRQEMQLNLNFGGPLSGQRRMGSNDEFWGQVQKNMEVRKKKIRREKRERRNLNFSSCEEDVTL